MNETKIFIDNIENIQTLLEKENRFFNISIFKQYPTITALLVILLLSLSFFFAESFKSKDYYHKELDLFLTWLKNAFEVKTPNKT